MTRGDQGRPRRRGKLRDRLILAFLLPTLALGVGFGFYVHLEAKHALEQEAGDRLVAVARAVAGQLSASRDGERIRTLSQDLQRVRRNLRRKLEVVREATGVRRLFVVDAELRSRLDTRSDVPFGELLPEVGLDRHELRAVWEGGTAASRLFTASDGARYLHGYAPVRGKDGAVVAALGVEGSAEWYGTLDRFALTLASAGVVLIALVVLGAVLVSRRITGPLARLAAAAERIGGGRLEDPVAVEGGDEVALLASRLDAMRSALLARDQELQMMLAGIAHEVRNPLGGMELFAGLLRDELGEAGPDADSQLSHVARIQSEIGHLNRVVEEFLAYARRHPVDRRVVEVLPFLEEATGLVDRSAGDSGVELVIEVPPGTKASFDPEPMRRAVLNLVENAIHATASGGTVTVSGHVTAGEASIEVSDTGRGIPRDQLEAVLRPFFTTREKGTGLGLALCRRTAEAHGGTLDLRSEEGVGTTVRLRWPEPAEEASGG